MKKFFENLLLRKSSSPKPLVRIWNNFTRLFLVWPFSKVVRESLIRGKTWLPWGEDFSLCGLQRNSSPLKPLVRFWNNFTGLFLGWPFSKIVRKILIRGKTWLPWGEDFSLCRLQRNSSPLKPLVRFWNNFTGLFLGWPFLKSVRKIMMHWKTWPPWGRRLFALA